MAGLEKAFLLFSGHNPRAVIALCRFFFEKNIPFFIVARDKDDPVLRSAWSERVVFCRSDGVLDLELFQMVYEAARGQGAGRLLLCSTSEYINQYTLRHRCELDEVGIITQLPIAKVYLDISNKGSSYEVVKSIPNIQVPRTLDWESVKAPCVFKPYKNLNNDEVSYPVIALADQEARGAVEQLDHELWFPQEYINGQSYYLCGYLCKDGRFAHYWQENLLQQSGGKSIVLARVSENPGVNEGALFESLREFGYFGPLMMEVLKGEDNFLYYVEINPRFWGPLQLALDAYPEMLELFAQDSGFKIKPSARKDLCNSWYAWLKGAEGGGCKKYPSINQFSEEEVRHLLDKHDVYGKPDTIRLHGEF